MGATTTAIQANLTALGFTNPSQAAIYNKIAEALGIPIDNTIQEMTNSENNILSIISNQRYGKAGYYTAKALAFQYGDDLIVDPTTLQDVYATINPLNQIVTQAAFEELVSGNSSQLFLKIAASDPLTGNLIPLTAPQLAAFINYFVNFEIPGLPITIISAAGNILSFQAIATVLATYDLAELQTALATALTTFDKTFPFNGEFYTGQLQNYINTNVPGMKDFYVYNTALDNVPFAGSISMPSGYFNYLSTIIPNIATAFTYNSVSA